MAKKRGKANISQNETIDNNQDKFKRVTLLEIEHRIDMVAEYIVRGYKLPDIKKIAVMPVADGGFGWNISLRQIENYYKDGFDLATKAITKEDIRNQFFLMVGQLDNLYRKSLAEGNDKLALETLKEKNKVLPLPAIAEEIAQIKSEDEIRLKFVSLDDIQSSMNAALEKSEGNED